MFGLPNVRQMYACAQTSTYAVNDDILRDCMGYILVVGTWGHTYWWSGGKIVPIEFS